MFRMMSMALAVLALVFIGVDRLLIYVVARRIDKTNAALERITAGDLDVRVKEEGTREFRSLAQRINITVDALNGWIDEERIIGEMAIGAYRAGAGMYITYFAKELAKMIDEGKIG